MTKYLHGMMYVKIKRTDMYRSPRVSSKDKTYYCDQEQLPPQTTRRTIGFRAESKTSLSPLLPLSTGPYLLRRHLSQPPGGHYLFFRHSSPGCGIVASAPSRPSSIVSKELHCGADCDVAVASRIHLLSWVPALPLSACIMLPGLNSS